MMVASVGYISCGLFFLLFAVVLANLKIKPAVMMLLGCSLLLAGIAVLLGGCYYGVSEIVMAGLVVSGLGLAASAAGFIRAIMEAYRK